MALLGRRKRCASIRLIKDLELGRVCTLALALRHGGLVARGRGGVGWRSGVVVGARDVVRSATVGIWRVGTRGNAQRGVIEHSTLRRGHLEVRRGQVSISIALAGTVADTVGLRIGCGHWPKSVHARASVEPLES